MEKQASASHFTVSADSLPAGCTWNKELGTYVDNATRMYEICPGADAPTCEVEVIGHTKTSLIHCDDDEQFFTVSDICASE